MTETERIQPRGIPWPYFLICVVALLGHGLLLLNDGTYFDDVILQPLLAEGTWSELKNWFIEMGMPVSAYFFRGVKLAGGYYQAAAFLAKFLSAILVYKICLRLAWLSRYEALGIALLSLVYPAYQVAVTFCNLHYEFYYCLFLLAAWLQFRPEQPTKSGAPGLFVRLASLLLFFLAFNLNSLLVFYFSFLLLLFLHRKAAHHLSWPAAARTLLPRHIDFILLPFLYWIGKKMIFPAHGEYEGYNALNLNLNSLATHMLNAIKTAGYAQVEGSFAGLMGQPILWIVFLVGIALAYSRHLAKGNTLVLSDSQVESEFQKTKWIFLYGALMLLSGVFPYAAVGLSPSLSGWNTRHAILVGLPMAIMIIAVLRTIWVRGLCQKPRRFDRRLASLLVGGSLLVAFTLSTIEYYISWQARAVKDRAIMSDLAEAATIVPIKAFSVFWIDDQFPAGGERIYRFYEWAAMFKHVWGRESFIGLQIQGYGNNPAILPALGKYYTKRNLLSEFDPSGCQVLLTIKRGTLNYSDAQLVREYFEHRFFRKDEITDFLRGVANLNFQFPQTEDKRCFVKLDK